MKTGRLNAITDVEGVKVGQKTIKHKDVNTGVTAVIPRQGDVFHNKVRAASVVFNGYGKSLGLIQVDELGTIETPVVLTNTLSVGTAHQALVEYMLERNADIGEESGTVNPVVGECNDQYLNDIRGFYVKKNDVSQAIKNAGIHFKEGAVGAGTGTSCFGLKGGIGTASRRIKIGDKEYIIGALVQSNFGKLEDFILNGEKLGLKIKKHRKNNGEKISDSFEDRGEEKGSIMMILATNIPLTARQLKRVARRCQVGLSRTGSYMANGSGDIVVAFSVGESNKNGRKDLFKNNFLDENNINSFFRATVESTEEAIYNSMITAETTKGRKGRIRLSLQNYMSFLKNN